MREKQGHRSRTTRPIEPARPASDPCRSVPRSERRRSSLARRNRAATLERRGLDPTCRPLAAGEANDKRWEHGNELRSRSSTAQEGLGGESALEGHQARLHGGGRRAPARLGPHRAHARAPRRREAVEARQRGAVRQFARRHDRQPGDAAGEGRAQGDLPVRLAGRGRCQHRRRDVPGPVAVSGQLGAERRQAHQQHVRCAPTRSSTWKAPATSTSSRPSSPTRKRASAAC